LFSDLEHRNLGTRIKRLMLKANLLTSRINFDCSRKQDGKLVGAKALCLAASLMLVMGPANVAMAASDPSLNFKIYSPQDPPATAPATKAETADAPAAGGDMQAASAAAPAGESPKSIFEEALPQLDTTPDKPNGALPANAGPDNDTAAAPAPAKDAPAAAAPTAAAAAPEAAAATPEAAAATPEAAAATPEAAAATPTAAAATPEAAPAAADATTPAATPAAGDAAAATTADATTAVETKGDAAKGEKTDKVLQGYIRVVPKDTKIPIVMDTAVDSDTSQESDEFSARTSEDLTIDGSVVVPAGSVIKGRIAQLNAPKAMSRSGSVSLKFDTITTPDNRQIPLVANIVARGGVVHARRGMKDIAINAGAVAFPMLIGGVIGALAGKSNTTSTTTSTTKHVSKVEGAAIGLAVGLAVGAVILCAKKGKKVEVRPGDELKIELAEDLRMPTM
jgi:hypothetical protein